MRHLLKSRCAQGAGIVIASLLLTSLVLAAALAWGPHQCKAAFPMVIGCAIGSYEALAGGMLAASTALFAGWLAWSGIQTQIASEEKRASAERIEVEAVLQSDLNYRAEGLGSIWKLLLAISSPPEISNADARDVLEGVVYGIERIASPDWIATSRAMVEALGWERRRYYNELFQGLERLRQFQDINNFDTTEALAAVRSVSDYFELLNPATERYFRGLWRRSPKAWTLGYAISVHAGLFHIHNEEYV